MIKTFLSQRWWMAAIIAAAVIALAFFVNVRSSHAASPSIPTAEAHRGDFVDYLSIRGEIKARQSSILTAPSSAGDLQIFKLARTGAQVKAGDIVVQFDTTTLQHTLDQKRTDLATAEAQIHQTEAQEHLTEEQNLTDSLTAKYNVESARLDASKAEILSVIDGEKNKLALASSQEKLREADVKLSSGKDGSTADIAQQKKKRDKALFDVRLAEHQIAALTLRAPTNGVVTVLPNYRQMFVGGGTPDFREGDHAWAGAPIADIPDLTGIIFEARIEEADRGRLTSNQNASVHVDAVPDSDFNGTVDSISTLAKLDFSGWPPTKSFLLDLKIVGDDPRIKPGMKANARIVVNTIPNSILVPTQAIFPNNGSSVVYVQDGARFMQRPVTVGHRSGETAQIISGLKNGERVALKDPTQAAEK